jgi:NAD(P)-dependent dehydrogenase (short-subunit alcohol dehydrogenase family)
MSVGDFAGRVALITGGAGGLGQAIVTELKERGASVAVLDRGVEEGAGVYECDVTDSASVEQAVDRAERDLGVADMLVTCAGNSHMGIPSETLDDERWAASVDVMQTGVFYSMRALARRLINREAAGAIVNITSVRAIAPKNGGMAYCAPKAAVTMMTEIAASEWGPHGIRVNAVAPGGMRTPMWDLAVAEGQLDEAEYLASIPLGRLGAPAEIARVAGFLLSGDAAYVNGATLLVDGGLNVFRRA